MSRPANASAVATAAAVFPIPVTTTGTPAGTYLASPRVALTTKYSVTLRTLSGHHPSRQSEPVGATDSIGCPVIFAIRS
ncbi:hypothetical protein GCM10009744_51540 [Kribbella alba]|uniref:Secreted protein n=1 Tax=Kribbella alba TaxID=190197 RepID=A0ABN2FLY1_9ACTN